MGESNTIKNEHVLISGGSRGIGLACASLLSQQFTAVSLFSRDATQLEKSARTLKGPAKIAFEPCDVTKQEQVKIATARIVEKSGPVTILVNNAGNAESSPFLKSSPHLWEKMLALNLMGTVNLTQAVLPSMLHEKFGRIVNIASTAGLKGYRYVSAYCAAKHAVIGLTRSLALECIEFGITVNAICPGFTETPMLQASLGAITQVTGKSESQVRESFLKETPLGRFIQPEEVASSVAWLVQREQAAITGQTIVISGGEFVA